MRPFWLAVALVALTPLASAAAAPAERSASGLTFRTPSRNIGCSYLPRSSFHPAFLRCDILSGLRPEPRRRCELDWTGVSMRLTGPAGAVCAGDTAYPQRGPILAYGRSWRRDGLTCLSQRAGLRCTNRSGRGFILAREAWRVF